MWYFTWMLGIGFAVAISILNALWGDFEQDRDGNLSEDFERSDAGQTDTDKAPIGDKDVVS